MNHSRDGRTLPGPDVAGLRAFAFEDDRLPPAFVDDADRPSGLVSVSALQENRPRRFR